jgi:hypothetical protein
VTGVSEEFKAKRSGFPNVSKGVFCLLEFKDLFEEVAEVDGVTESLVFDLKAA